MYRRKSQKDVIAHMSIKETRDQIQAMVDGRSYNKSAFSLPAMQNIGTLPKDWQSFEVKSSSGTARCLECTLARFRVEYVVLDDYIYTLRTKKLKPPGRKILIDASEI